MSTFPPVSSQNLRAGGFEVDFGVGRIFELLWDEISRVFGDFLGLGDGAFHPLGARREDERGPVGLEHHAAFHRHCVGHGEGQRIAAGRTDVGERDARVAAGGFDDVHSRLEDAAFFSVPNHGGADAAFDAVGRVAALDFGQDCGLGPFGQPVDFHQRRVADGFGIVLEDWHDGVFLRCTEAAFARQNWSFVLGF